MDKMVAEFKRKHTTLKLFHVQIPPQKKPKHPIKHPIKTRLAHLWPRRRRCRLCPWLRLGRCHQFVCRRRWISKGVENFKSDEIFSAKMALTLAIFETSSFFQGIMSFLISSLEYSPMARHIVASKALVAASVSVMPRWSCGIWNGFQSVDLASGSHNNTKVDGDLVNQLGICWDTCTLPKTNIAPKNGWLEY